MQQVKRYTLLFFCVLGMIKNVSAQKIPYPEKPVTIHVSDQSFSEVFKILSAQTGVVFSYTGFNDQQKVSANYYKKPLRLVLTELLQQTSCTFKIKDKYIILHCGEKNTATEPPGVLNGYVFNASDSSHVQDASIYIKQSKNSAVSDKYGFFSISYSRSQPTLSLSVAKEDYLDTTLVVYNKAQQELVVYLYPRPHPLKKVSVHVSTPVEKPDSLFNYLKDSVPGQSTVPGLFGLWPKLKKANANFRNISDTLFSDFSVTFVPPLSTNKLLSVNTVNKYSVNVLIGSSKGVKAGEIGGLLNIDHGDVKYIQAAGLGNIVSGNVNGVQLAGLFNVDNKHMEAAQIAGLYNRSESLKGIQVAGLLNNVKTKTDGMQIAGLINYTDTLKGMQLAGLINISSQTKGMQLAAVMNKTDYLDGVQLAVFNFADTCEGIPFGLFSYVKKGYHKIEVGFDELLFGTLAFRTGTDAFHTIFMSSIQISGHPDVWSYGYGAGTAFRIKKKLFFVADLTSQQLQPTNNADVRLNLLHKLTAGLEYRAFSKFSIAIGPSLNMFISDSTGPALLNGKIPVSPFYNSSFETTNVKMWLGAKLSLKFF